MFYRIYDKFFQNFHFGLKGLFGVIVRKLLFTALRMAAQNPVVRRQALKAADKAVEAVRPGLLKASRRAGEVVRSASDELKGGAKKIKAGMEGEEILPPGDSSPKSSKRPEKNITPKK